MVVSRHYIALVFVCITVWAQKGISLEEAIALSTKNSPGMALSQERVAQQRALLGSTVSIGNLDLVFEAPTGKEQRLGVMQSIEFPLVYIRQYTGQKFAVQVAEAEASIAKEALKRSVGLIYNQLQFLEARIALIQKYDSLYFKIMESSLIKYKVGEIALLAKLNAEAKYRQMNMELSKAKSDFKAAQYIFAGYLTLPGDTSSYTCIGNLEVHDTTAIVALQHFSVTNSHVNRLYASKEKFSKGQLLTARSKRWPGFFMGYLNQADFATSNYYKLRFGLSFPLWYWSYNSKIKFAKEELAMTRLEAQAHQKKLASEYAAILTQAQQQLASLRYYHQVAQAQSTEILRVANESLKAGSIGYVEYLLSMEQSYQMLELYLEYVRDLNSSIISLKHLKGEN